jgi:hypothetical protein
VGRGLGEHRAPACRAFCCMRQHSRVRCAAASCIRAPNRGAEAPSSSESIRERARGCGRDMSLQTWALAGLCMPGASASSQAGGLCLASVPDFGQRTQHSERAYVDIIQSACLFQTVKRSVAYVAHGLSGASACLVCDLALKPQRQRAVSVCCPAIGCKDCSRNLTVCDGHACVAFARHVCKCAHGCM